MAANAIDLCLAADVAADLGVASDATVQRVVTAASRAIAVECGRSFEKATGIVEYPPSWAGPLLRVRRAPVLQVVSIYYGTTLVDPTVYECAGINADAGLILRLDGCPWLSTRIYGGRITDTAIAAEGRTDANGVKVTYDGGWVTPGQGGTVTLPEDIQEAAIQTAVALYRARGVDAAVQSESIGDWSVTYFDRAREVIPPAAQALLAPYVMRWVY